MDAAFLVADIGGTNARFAIAYIERNNHIRLEHIMVFPTENWVYMEDAIADYFSKVKIHPERGTIAFAGPVNDDEVIMTNGTWSFNQSDIAQILKMKEIRVINDFAAHACCLPLINENKLYKIGDGESVARRNKIVVGPGTGIGVGALVAVGDKWKNVATEGGHVGFSPSGDLEKEIYNIVSKEVTRLSAENILSGPAISIIYSALAEINGQPPLELSSKEISQQALEQNDQASIQTIEVYCGMIGSFASDMAGVFNATGGVYLTGGVLPKNKQLLLSSKFREKFEGNEDLPFVKNIPTYLIEEEFPALLGAAGYYSGMFL